MCKLYITETTTVKNTVKIENIFILVILYLNYSIEKTKLKIQNL